MNERMKILLYLSVNYSLYIIIVLISFSIYVLNHCLNESQSIQLYINNINNSNKHDNGNSTQNIGLFGIMTMIDSNRIPRHYEKYVKKINQIPGFTSYYINYKTTNTSFNVSSSIPANLYTDEYYLKIKNNHPRLKSRYKDIDLFVKDYFLLSYFYYETNYRWVYRGVDDTAINVNYIKEYFKLLESKYNPLKEKVILGNCLINSIYTFLQGGSGYIFSRKAVEEMLPHFKTVIDECNEPEDVLHNRFLEFLGISLSEASSEHMIGHSFLYSDSSRIYRNDFSGIHKCPVPTNVSKNQCRKFHSPVNQLIFLHQLSLNPNDAISLSDVLFNVKDDSIHWYMCRVGNPCLCRA